jgi:hypothetical protein
MFRTLLRSNLIKRFSHTHSKTIFPDNHNKIIEELLRENNQHLNRIADGIGYIFFGLLGIQLCVTFKPIR